MHGICSDTRDDNTIFLAALERVHGIYFCRPICKRETGSLEKGSSSRNAPVYMAVFCKSFFRGSLFLPKQDSRSVRFPVLKYGIPWCSEPAMLYNRHLRLPPQRHFHPSCPSAVSPSRFLPLSRPGNHQPTFCLVISHKRNHKTRGPSRLASFTAIDPFTTEGRLACLLFLTVTSNVAVNIHVPAFVLTSSPFFWAHT